MSLERYELLMKMAYPYDRANAKAEAAEYRKLERLHYSIEKDIYISISRSYLKERLELQALKVSERLEGAITNVIQDSDKVKIGTSGIKKLKELISKIKFQKNKEKIDEIIEELNKTIIQLGPKLFFAFMFVNFLLSFCLFKQTN